MVERSSAISGQTVEPGRGPAELLNVQEVAAVLKVSPRTVYRLSDSRGMPRPYKLGALVRWSRVAVEEWVANGCPTCGEGRQEDPR
ncbi:MAG: helix-turn-helix domain-containing protein [Planctomycetota bacterium]|nr:helix-turn-helix domain-containing protein [Planctomycetota bacterium]